MIALGCDHGGYELKQEIKKYLDEKGIEYKDYGCDSLDSVDYPVYAKKVAHAILDGECEKGILICGTGIGISITANKFKGIRAAVCTDCFTAEATRLHNDANILALGGRVVGPGLALKIVDTFLNTPFSNDERHIRRINQIVMGWINYYRIGVMKYFVDVFGQWLRHKIRVIILKQWKRPRRIYINLQKLNKKFSYHFSDEEIFSVANTRLGLYRQASGHVVNFLLSPKILAIKKKDRPGLVNPLIYYLS